MEYIVSWDEQHGYWELIEHDTVTGRKVVLQRYNQKKHAKKRARWLAKMDDASYVFYTKDSKSDRRVTERRDYS